MKTIELNNLNSLFRISGNKETRSIDIKSVTVTEKLGDGADLNLLVLDEKDITIFSQVLDLSKAGNGGTIAVNKRFVFYDHLSVQVKATGAETPFAVVINYD